MIQYIQLIIFTFLLGTFLYYQKDKIIDKFNSYGVNSFENFQNTGIGLGISNLFSLEKPKILTNEVNITTEGVPTIVLSDENDFTNQVSFFIQNFISLLPVNDPDNVINNLINVNNNKANLMIIQEEMLHNGVTGGGIFKNKPLKNIRFITGLYYETFMLITYPESGINSWKDIKGKIIGFLGKKSCSYMNGIKIAHAYGFNTDKDFRAINVDSMNRLSNLFFQRKVDAIFLTTTNKNQYLKNLAKKMSMKFIGTNDIDENIMKTYFPCDQIKYINTNNFYTNINTSSFIQTFATRSVLIANKDLDADYVYKLTETIFKRTEELRLLANNYLFNKDKSNWMDTVKDGFLPSEMAYIYEKFDYHKGSQKYYDNMYHSFETHIPKPIKDIPEENTGFPYPHAHIYPNTFLEKKYGQKNAF
jgi:TRAP transporter TAXI family solute receptor